MKSNALAARRGNRPAKEAKKHISTVLLMICDTTVSLIVPPRFLPGSTTVRKLYISCRATFVEQPISGQFTVDGRPCERVPPLDSVGFESMDEQIIEFTTVPKQKPRVRPNHRAKSRHKNYTYGTSFAVVSIVSLPLHCIYGCEMVFVGTKRGATHLNTPHFVLQDSDG